MPGVRHIVPASVVRTHVDTLVAHVRTYTDGELISAINFGVHRVVRALLSSRMDYFVSYVDPFTLQSGAEIIDVGSFTPAMLRPVQFISSSGLYDLMYRQVIPGHRDRNAISENNIIYYDLISGAIPMATTTISAVDGANPTTICTVGATFHGGLSIGTRLGIAGAGKQSSVGGVLFGPDEHACVVAELLSGNRIRIAPASVISMTTGATVTRYATVAMRLNGPMQQTISGRLIYQYLPPRITSLNDMLDPVLGDYVEVIAHYAAAMLLRGTRDQGANDMLALADAMRKEVIQESDPRGVGFTQSLGVGVFEES